MRRENNKSALFVIILILSITFSFLFFYIPLISALSWSGTSSTTVDNANLLDGYDSSYFMPLNLSPSGNFNFNGGWLNNGLSIINGDIYAQTGYFYNLTSLTISNLNINGSLIPVFNNTFDIGSGSYMWKDGYFNGNLKAGQISGTSFIINGVATSEITDGTTGYLYLRGKNPSGLVGMIGGNGNAGSLNGGQVIIASGDGSQGFGATNGGNGGTTTFIGGTGAPSENGIGGNGGLFELSGGSGGDSDTGIGGNGSGVNILAGRGGSVGGTDGIINIGTSHTSGINIGYTGMNVNFTGGLNSLGTTWINGINVSNWLYNQTYTGGTYNSTYATYSNGIINDSNANLTTLNVSTRFSVANKLFVNASSVGIGTSASQANLHIIGSYTEGTANKGQIRIGETASYYGNIGYDEGGGTTFVIDNSYNAALSAISLRIANSAKMNIMGSGNVGIGTATPNYTLEINANAKGLNVSNRLFANVTDAYIGTTAVSPWLYNMSVASGDYNYNQTTFALTTLATNVTALNASFLSYINLNITNLNASMIYNYNQTQTIWNLSGTNLFSNNLANSIGVGTAIPKGKLDVVGGGGLIVGNDTFNYLNISKDGNYYRIGSTGVNWGYLLSGGNLFMSSLGAYSDVLVLGYGGTNSRILTSDTNENLTIAPNGAGFIVLNNSVGIMTKNPTQKLEINGSVNITGTLFASGINVSNWLYNQTTAIGNFNYNQSNWNLSGNNLYTKNLAYNVGIGTKTFESWGSVYPTLQLGGTGAIMGASSNSGLYVIDNLYYDGSDWRHRTADQNGSWISQYLGDISFNFADGSGKLADDIVTTTTSMIIRTSGNVGIGTTSPNYLLEIANSPKALNVSGSLYVNNSAIIFNKDTYLGANIAHGQIDWLYNPISSTSGTTFCNYYDNQITGISYTCVDCVSAGDGTSLDCTDTTVDKNCACQID